MRDAMASSIAWKLLERGGYQLVQMAVQVVLARLLAPSEFGAMAIILVFVNVGNVFVQSGLPTALVQTPVLHEKDASTEFWLSLTIAAVIYAAVFASAPHVASFYGLPGIVWPLRALSLLLPIGALSSVQVALVQRALEFRKIFIATLWSVGLSAAVGVCVAIAGGGLWALVLQQLTYQAISCTALFVQLDWRPALEFDPARARELLSFGWKLLLSGLLDTGYQSLSDLIIGRQFSPTSLGLVSQGKKYPAAVGQLLDGAIQPVMLSAAARAQGDRGRVRALVRRALKTSTFLVIPAMSLFAVVAPTLVPLLLGEQWSGSVWFMQVYCFVYALLPIHTTNLQALNGMGRSDLFLRLELVKKAYGVAWISFAAFVARDVRLMVAGYLVTGLLSTVVNAWPNRRVIGYSYGEQIRDISPSVLLTVAAVTAAWALSLLPVAGAALVALQVVAFAVVYLGLSALFGVEELSYLVSTARGLLSGRSRG